MTDIEAALACIAGQCGVNSDCGCMSKVRAEVERHIREKVALAALVSRERDDNERLRAALEDCIAGRKDWIERAKAALEPKP